MSKGRRIPYSDAEMAWLEANRTLPIGNLHGGFRAAFDRADVEAKHLHALRKRKGWLTGRTGQFERGHEPFNKGKPHPSTGRAAETQFKKGQLPHNTRFLGHERISKDGYVEISVAETNPHTGYKRRYVLKHRYLWEKAYGAVPAGMALKCLDSDRQNTDPSNWKAVPRSLLPRLNGGRNKTGLAYDEASPEVKPALLALAALAHGARSARKRGSA